MDFCIILLLQPVNVLSVTLHELGFKWIFHINTMIVKNSIFARCLWNAVTFKNVFYFFNIGGITDANKNIWFLGNDWKKIILTRQNLDFLN